MPALSRSLPAPVAAGMRATLLQPRARRWYFGALFAAALWGTGAWMSRLFDETPLPVKAAIAFNMLVFVGLYLVVPPLSWGRTVQQQLAAFAVLMAADLPLFITLGPSAAWTWTFAGVAAAMQLYRGRTGIWLIIGLAAAALLLQAPSGLAWDQALVQPAIILSVGLMMHSFGRQTQALGELRATQHELAELAVREERNRVARDMHDILGHSLTVIAVKAELAGRLIPGDPVRASEEVAQLEDLARGALADVRATVSGYRGVNISTESASARSALEAAGIEAALPVTADEVPLDRRELFGWVLREAITNVVRHSGAARCTVTLTRTAIQVDDDGGGPGRSTTGGGLQGLAERVAARGATLTLGRSDAGGFRLRVSA